MSDGMTPEKNQLVVSFIAPARKPLRSGHLARVAPRGILKGVIAFRGRGLHWRQKNMGDTQVLQKAGPG